MIRTRFPPEPNGYLHLGHIKAMHRNFNYALENNGECILRLDDTNPDVEKKEYVDKIIEVVNWLGYKPCRITYTSDYFDILNEYAIKLIKQNDAYIDNLDKETMKKYRREHLESPSRDRPIKDNLELFNQMAKGQRKDIYLRAKIDMPDNKNWDKIDIILYRYKNNSHYRWGNKYNIYPSYDFSHSIVDSLEDITHSFCTSEFFIRRPIYYWILNKLSLKKPIVKETNRLELEEYTLSKRKIKTMIELGEYNGWDDPRILTICGLRNRGYNPEILKSFIDKLGYTDNTQAVISKSLLDICAREWLNIHANRCFCILNPLKINIINFNNKNYIAKPNHPLDDSKGERKIKIGSTIYIDKDDFRKKANKKYFRLTCNNAVRLKYYGIIEYVNHEEDENGDITRVDVRIIDKNTKVKGTIHWLCEFDHIVLKTFSKKIDSRDAIIEKNLTEEYYQFERIGYYKFAGNGVYHHLVDLKENKYKNV